jgi:hypothetical protein
VPQFTGDDGISDGYPRLMEEALRAALDVLLPELQRTAGLRPLIEERGDWVMLLNQEGHGQGVQLRGDGEPDELAQLADQVQEWAVEELWNQSRSATWPECPFHPDSHPLEPAVVAGTATWRCPKTSESVASIGALST